MIILKQLVWIGSSRSDLISLPPEVQDDVGYALYQAQSGCFPDLAKPLKNLGGVIEIISDFDKNAYRVVFTAKLGQRIYVLHAFQKKSKSGIKTPKEDIDLIKRRLQVAKEINRGGS